jgi:hypothetical protein
MSRGGRLLPYLLLLVMLPLPPPAAAQEGRAPQAIQPAPGADKVLHALFGASCALLAAAAAAPALREAPWSDRGCALGVAGAGLGAALAGGAAKELLDLGGFGDADWLDLLATAAGGLAASAAVLAAAGSDREARLAPVYASFGIALALPPAGGLLRRLGLRASRCGS